jgi:hypothetical protein
VVAARRGESHGTIGLLVIVPPLAGPLLGHERSSEPTMPPAWLAAAVVRTGYVGDVASSRAGSAAAEARAHQAPGRGDQRAAASGAPCAKDHVIRPDGTSAATDDRRPLTPRAGSAYMSFCSKGRDRRLRSPASATLWSRLGLFCLPGIRTEAAAPHGVWATIVAGPVGRREAQPGLRSAGSGRAAIRIRVARRIRPWQAARIKRAAAKRRTRWREMARGPP